MKFQLFSRNKVFLTIPTVDSAVTFLKMILNQQISINRTFSRSNLRNYFEIFIWTWPSILT